MALVLAFEARTLIRRAPRLLSCAGAGARHVTFGLSLILTLIPAEVPLIVRVLPWWARRDVEYARWAFLLTLRAALELLAAHAPDFDHLRFGGGNAAFFGRL